MSNRRIVSRSLLAATLVASTGYVAATAWAAGAPTDQLVFTGTLLNNGSPVVDASHSIRLAFYDVPTDGTSIDQDAGSIRVRDGRFRILISNADILNMIRDTPDV